jgi:hypothetical protein
MLPLLTYSASRDPLLRSRMTSDASEERLRREAGGCCLSQSYVTVYSDFVICNADTRHSFPRFS